MPRPLPAHTPATRVGPTGGKRSSKRDLVVRTFQGQEGHQSADDLFDAVRRLDPRIGRATVYRTLQWMVEAGIARKVDFGEGRFRYEPSHGHPRHFHFICDTCHRSSEFLSSDIEVHLEEIAAARNFAATQAVVQISGTCEECRTGRSVPAIDGGKTDQVFARDALRMAIATERSGLDFYTRAAKLTHDARGRKVFERLAADEHEHLTTLQKRYRELIDADPELEACPTFLFFKGAASGIFAAGTDKLRTGIDDRQALLIGIDCERGSHEFFKRYGERFEDSEGKQIFLEFADEEREHLELLTREYQALVARDEQRRPRGRTAAEPPR